MAVRLRPRNAFEALDLGVALVRANLRPIYAVWFSVYVPAAIVAHAIFWNEPFWAWLLLWWLKPAFDRAVLAVLAPALFGEPRAARAFFHAPLAPFRNSGLFPALTWRRFDLARSFHLAVHQLERLRGASMRQRLRVLDRDSRGAAVWLTFLLANLEGILLIAVSLAVALMAPVQTPIDTVLESWGRKQFTGGAAGGLAGTIIGLAAMSLVEPLYVGCGFMLYLQRRTHLEGWDIELRFRQLASRLATAAAIGALAIGVSLAIPSNPAFAAKPDPTETPAKREIREVLKDPVFGHEEPYRSLKYVGPEWKSDNKPREIDWDWLLRLGELLGSATRAIAWVAAAAVIAFALYYLARYIRMHGLAGARRARPDFLFGFDVRPGSLPDDVGAAAEALAREGSIRSALSLLYRGALVRFMDEGLELLHGDTEGDCVRRVEAFAAPKRRLYFMRLVLAWQSHAYGHRDIDRDAVVALAREWRTMFERPASDARGSPEAQPA